MDDILGLLSSVINLIFPLLTAFSGWAFGRLRTAHHKDIAVEDGVKMLLRVRIIERAMYYLDQESVPPYGLEVIKGLYKCYQDLGNGDHSVGDLVEKVQKLQIKGG